MTTKITRVAGTSRRVIDETWTYDPEKPTTSGWRVTFYADGHAAIESHSRVWRHGQRYASKAGMYTSLAEVMAQIKPSDEEQINPRYVYPRDYAGARDSTRCRWGGWHQTRAGGFI